MADVLTRWPALVALALAVLLWRGHGLASRPMHADEANQAVRAGMLVEAGTYAYDPRDHHGPSLYYAAAALAYIRGERDLSHLQEGTVRMVPVIAGAVSVLLLGLLAQPLGRGPALAAAAFLGLSAPAAYYGRYFIQETLLGTFLLAALLLGRNWWATGRLGWALGAGAAVGLMAATKESTPVLVAASVAGVLACGTSLGRLRRRAGHACLAAAVAAAVGALLFTSFGTRPGGFADALAGFGLQASRATSGSTGHEKPWWYYAALFGWQRNGGLVFEQAGFAALALAGLWVALREATKLLRWAAAYTAAVLLAFSLVPYKTPWNVIHLVPGMALLAAGFLGWLARRGATARVAALAAFLGVAFLMALQCDRVTRVYASDPRNPYAYVHSSPDVAKARSMASAALARDPGCIIRVVGPEYWPLPWYLRSAPRVGYWPTPPADCDAGLVFASADQAPAVRARLHGTYRQDYLGLRPGLVMVVFERIP